ncbi:MAG: ABC transporter substrate-binding protein [Chloroflexi bacterium]|nr:ABC transporter substrate-binding protein [Chloroflexota bacterium]
MRKSYRKMLGLALAPTLAVLVACGGGAAAPTATRLAPQPSPTTAPRATAAATPTSAPARVVPTGQLNVGMRGTGVGLDPHFQAQCHYATWYTRIFEGLTNRAPSGKIEPALATSWDFAPDGKSVTWKLRKGVKFHNGDDFTASDVLWTIERGRTHPSPYLYRTQLDRVSKTTAVDDYTVRMDLGAYFFELPDGWMDVFFGMVPEKYTKSLANPWNDLQRQPVGTGPYKFVELKTNDYFTIEANESYWGMVSKVKTFKTVSVPDATTRVTMLKTGQMDIVEYVPPQMLDDVKKMPNVTLELIKALDTLILMPVTAQPANLAMKDKRVRQALWYAQDVDTMVDKLWRGSAIKANDLIAPGFVGHNDKITPHPYDPAKAKKLLAEAGFAGGLKLRGAYSSGTTAITDEWMEATRLYWADVGIDMKWEKLEGAAMSELTPRKYQGYDMYVSNSRNIGYDPIRDLTFWIHSKGGQSSHANPEWDKMIDPISLIPDPAARLKAIVDAYAVLVGEEVSVLPVFHPLYTVAYRNDKIKEFPMTQGWSVYPRNLNYIVPR